MTPPLTFTFDLTAPAPLSTGTLIVNLVIDAVLTSILGWYYARYGRTLANRTILARTLPFISLTTVLIISVVKSSLALSLGLVGALSIVRFRTPIKEPEELAYLFMAIALGLGLGADQRVATVAAFAVILLTLSLRLVAVRSKKNHNLYLNIEAPALADGEPTFETVTRLLTKHVNVADLRRLDVREGMLQATFYVDCDSDRALVAAMDDLQRHLPGASITFIDQDQTIGL